MQSGRLKQLFVHYVTGSDCSYRELGPVGKLTRLLWISGLRYTVDRNSLRAVALTYYTLFAVVPMLALAFGIAKGFELQKKLQEILVDKLANQREILEWIYQFADTTLRQTQGGIIAGAGVIVLLWTVMWLVNNVEKSFNAIWNLPPRGNLFRRVQRLSVADPHHAVPDHRAVQRRAGAPEASGRRRTPRHGGHGALQPDVRNLPAAADLRDLFADLLHRAEYEGQVPFGDSRRNHRRAAVPALPGRFHHPADQHLPLQQNLRQFRHSAAVPRLAQTLMADRAVRGGGVVHPPAHRQRALRPARQGKAEPETAPRIPAADSRENLPDLRPGRGSG